MNSVRTGAFRSSLLVAIASWVVDGHAWAQSMPSPVMPPATPKPAAEGGGAAIDAVGEVVGRLVVIGVTGMLFAFRTRQQSDAVQFLASISYTLCSVTSL